MATVPLHYYDFLHFIEHTLIPIAVLTRCQLNIMIWSVWMVYFLQTWIVVDLIWYKPAQYRTYMEISKASWNLLTIYIHKSFKVNCNMSEKIDLNRWTNIDHTLVLDLETQDLLRWDWRLFIPWPRM